jgi:hypothetical protein
MDDECTAARWLGALGKRRDFMSWNDSGLVLIPGQGTGLLFTDFQFARTGGGNNGIAAETGAFTLPGTGKVNAL